MNRRFCGKTLGFGGFFYKKIVMNPEDRIREMMRFKHYSIRTEGSYAGWYKQFVGFH